MCVHWQSRSLTAEGIAQARLFQERALWQAALDAQAAQFAEQLAQVRREAQLVTAALVRFPNSLVFHHPTLTIIIFFFFFFFGFCWFLCFGWLVCVLMGSRRDNVQRDDVAELRAALPAPVPAVAVKAHARFDAPLLAEARVMRLLRATPVRLSLLSIFY